jgi:hypothetical protein
VSYRFLACALVTWLAMVCGDPATAAAAKIPVCGTNDADGNTILGTLALNDNSSTIKAYGTATGDHHLALLFDVAGCTLPSGTTIEQKQVTILPAANAADDLPGDPTVNVTVDNPPDATAVAATVNLKLDDVAPGARGGIVRIKMPGTIHDSFTPISVSRTDGLFWPIIFGLIGALGGLIWAIGLHAADRIQVTFGLRQKALLLVVTIGAGVVAGYGYWDNQDVWTAGANGFATSAAGFAASTVGALAGVTAALYSPPKDAGSR